MGNDGSSCGDGDGGDDSMTKLVLVMLVLVVILLLLLLTGSSELLRRMEWENADKNGGPNGDGAVADTEDEV